MRIILNSSILRARQTGIGTYVSELSEALRNLDELQLHFFDGREIAVDLNRTVSATRGRWSTWLREIPGAYKLRRHLEQKRFDRSMKRLQPDVYHDPSLWPLHFDGPTVMTVHDLTHIDFPHTQPRARVREIEKQLPRALARTARILVDSQFIADQLQKHYGISPAKIAVAPLAHNRHFEPRRETQLQGTLSRFRLHHRHYFLCVGTLEPRKNLLLALRAHAALPASLRQRFPLVVAGDKGWLAQAIETELEKATATGYVLQLGYIDRDDLADLLAGARAFIFPSLYEGFGIPVLEAMASGVPVISSNAASLPEVGGDAVRYIDPRDEAALMHSMRELIEDDAECERLIAAGIARAKLFSWEQCAALTAAAYRVACAR